MTTDSAKPTVITAAQFASEYVEYVASGKCVVMDEAKCIVMRVSSDECTDGTILLSYTDGAQTYWWEYDVEDEFTVHWLPATSSSVDEVTRLRAENARLRAALDKCARLWPGLGCTIPEEWMSKERHYQIGFQDGLARVSRIARAALDATEEAQS